MKNSPVTRRDFLTAAAAGAVLPVLPHLPSGSGVSGRPRLAEGTAASDPWLEVSAAALRTNATQVARLAGGRPVLAVIKNNAYGLGLETVGGILDGHDAVAGLAVVKVEEALRLVRAQVRKPVLLMAHVTRDEGIELSGRGVHLAPFSDDAPTLLSAIAASTQAPVPIHFYVDTGMSRLGMPYHKALPWMERVAGTSGVRIEGTFMTFTEDDAFDDEQLARFTELVTAARARGIPLGRLHAASSHALFLRPAAHLDLVRPGLALFGAYPAEVPEAHRTELRTAVALKARVARVEQLRTGDSVSYGRSYVAAMPTWIATIPCGHSDGYPRSAVKGCQVLINGRLFPVIGAVSASHTIVELGAERRVQVGDVATLVGPDDPAITPNAVAARAGVSVYDILMHLSAELPRVLV